VDDHARIQLDEPGQSGGRALGAQPPHAKFGGGWLECDGADAAPVGHKVQRCP